MKIVSGLKISKNFPIKHSPSKFALGNDTKQAQFISLIDDLE